MPTMTPISPEKHRFKRWKNFNGYGFAASESLAPLVVAEVVRAAPALPIAFIPFGEEFLPTAVLGVEPNQNLFVMSDGTWNGPYIPAAFRGYPFALATANDGKPVLCIDEASGLLTDGPDGSAFFEEDGKPSKQLAGVVNFLHQAHESRLATRRMCSVLKAHGLIQRWPVTLNLPDSQKHVQGLFRIDEAALNALSGAAFLEVRASGALPLVYCQLLSMQHMSLLGQLGSAKAESAARRLPVNAVGELDLEFMNDGPLLDFSRLK